MHMPSVTVITACHKALAYLKLHSSSVLESLGKSDEWFVQDSASGDGAVDYLKRLGDSRITIFSEPDTGVYDAFNRAVLCARGDYFLFLGSDDSLMIHMDEIRPLLVDPMTIYYGDARLASSGRIYGGVFSAKRLARTNVCHQAILYPRNVFLKLMYDLNYPIQADWVLNMACWRDPDFRFQYIGACIALFDDRNGLSSQRVDVAFQWDYPRLLRHHFSLHACLGPWVVHAAGNLARRLIGLPMPALRRNPELKIKKKQVIVE